jgi:lysyl-tRNA synthetase, class II
VAKRAMMLKEGLEPYPVHLNVTTTIDELRARYEGTLEPGQET